MPALLVNRIRMLNPRAGILRLAVDESNAEEFQAKPKLEPRLILPLVRSFRSVDERRPFLLITQSPQSGVARLPVVGVRAQPM